MENRIDITKYEDYFHDGTLFGIVKLKDEIAFKMSSAEVDPSEIEKDLILSKDHTIQGILHLHQVQSIHLTGEHKLENLFEVFNLGTILDFEVKNKTVEFGVLWENCLPKVHTNEFTTIVIQAKKIWWENIPDLNG